MSELLLLDILETYCHTLYVIGNGFDKAHGIPSGYDDFRDWLELRGNMKLVEMMRIFFGTCESDFWGDIEHCLEEYDMDHISESCNPNVKIDYNHPAQYAVSYADAPEAIFSPYIDELKVVFTEWVDSLSLDGIKRQLELPMEGRYFTFNYLETLEAVYGVPRDKVMHIHGKRGEGDYLFGHNVYLSASDVFDDKDLIYETEAKKHIVHTMNGLYKGCEGGVKCHESYFNSLGDVENVVVRGHSLSLIDMPYFQEIRNFVRPDARWIFYYHSEEKDIPAIERGVKILGIDNGKWAKIKW